MAVFQVLHKWILVFLPILTICIFQMVSGCHPSSKKLHICLNIYLERDFPLIETIVKGQERFGRGRVILEGPDLRNICNDIGELKDCYANLLSECDTLWQYDRYMRMMNVLIATHDYLCPNGNTNNVKDLLLKSGCLIRAQSQISNCKGFDWSMSWREVLRMQVSPQDRCKELESYKHCLMNSLVDAECGADTSGVYQRLINVWLETWCAIDSTPYEDKIYFFLSLYQRE